MRWFHLTMSHDSCRVQTARRPDLFPINYSLISQTLVAIEQMYDSTIAEAQRQQGMPHDGVVAMGIHANVIGHREAISHDVGQHMMTIRTTGHPMNDIIRCDIVGPSPLSISL